MENKQCLVYETLGKVADLQVVESKSTEMMRLTGVFGVCGVKNQNNRVYDKENYKQMVESLQHIIKETGCPGELEHPNSMNINLENVSHKIEDIQMNEDGTITGTILLLNTPKGKIAQAIVEGGLPLYISSRGAGTITNEGHVTLSTIKTYDLVGTPGFSQAKLSLKSNQTLECLNEGLEDSNQIWAIVEGEDLLSSDSKDDKKSEDTSDSKEDKKDGKKEDKKEDTKEKSEEPKEDPKTDENDKNNKNNDNQVDMNELKQAIDKLSEKVTSLEAQLHIAQESLSEVQNKEVNYSIIEQWVTEEFGNQFKNQILDEISENIKQKIDESRQQLCEQVQEWVVEEFAPQVQGWVTEEFAPQVQDWVTEEFAPQVQDWVTEEFAPEVQGWITEEFAPQVQGWVTEEFAGVVDQWVNEEFAPQHMEIIESKVNENLSHFLDESKTARLDEIDSLLESISNENDSLQNIVKEQHLDNKFRGIYVVENMPAEYIPSWKMLSEERQAQIVRNSKAYDFTKDGVLESFWATVDFNETPSQEINETAMDPMSQYHMNIAARMKGLRRPSDR